MSGREDYHGVRSGEKRKGEVDEATLGVAPKLPKTAAEKDRLLSQPMPLCNHYRTIRCDGQLTMVHSYSSNRLIVVLEGASLETVKVGKGYELLNCDDHAHVLKKHKREPAECRPDISHQVGRARSFRTVHLKPFSAPSFSIDAMMPFRIMQMLLTLLDSPLNKAGKLQVYIHTEKNVLIEV